MKYAKEVAILKIARERIESCINSMVCLAIYDAGRAMQCDVYELTSWVDRLLGDSCSYEVWLQKNHPELLKT